MRPIDDGLIYHVINRGNNRQRVFAKKGDFEAFLAAMAELKERKPFELYGYCLLDNHFHFLIRPRGASISRIMQSLFGFSHAALSQASSLRRPRLAGKIQKPGHPDDEHLLTVLRYIEANPLRARIVRRAEEYPWSSYPHHRAGQANDLLERLALYEELARSPAALQRAWAENGHRPIEDETLAAIRRANATGLPLGNPAWVERLAKNSISPSVHAADHEN